MQTLCKIAIALLVIFITPYQLPQGNAFAVRQRQSLADVPVHNLRLHERNLPLTLFKLADEYQVPIGFEVSPKDDLLKRGTVTIEISDGTLKDALDSLIKQNPLYTWQLEEGVINVLPIDTARDSILKSLLETKIQNFSIEGRMSRLSFRQALTEEPMLKSILKKHGIVAENETFTSRDVRALGGNFSLHLSGVTVKSILNRVIKESNTKDWIINRYGERKGYLLINL